MEQNVAGFPEDKKLLRLADAANWTAKLAVLVSTVYAGLRLYNYLFYTFRGVNLAEILVRDGYNVLISVVSFFDTVIYAVFTYVVLRGIEEILYLLMDIRDVVQPGETEIDTQEEDVDADFQLDEADDVSR